MRDTDDLLWAVDLVRDALLVHCGRVGEAGGIVAALAEPLRQGRQCASHQADLYERLAEKDKRIEELDAAVRRLSDELLTAESIYLMDNP